MVNSVYFNNQIKRPSRFALIASSILLGAAAQSSYASVSCELDVINQWGTGSQIEVTVTNTGDTPSDQWAVSLAYSSSNHEISNSWNSTFTGDNPFVFTEPAWQPTIPTGQSHSFGFVVNHNTGIFEQPELISCSDEHQEPPIVTNRDMVIVHDEVLDATNITLNEVFNNLAAEGDNGTGATLFRQFWDSQRSPTVLGGQNECETKMNNFGGDRGTSPTCNRLETNYALLSEEEIEVEMSAYDLIAAVNRIDLRRGDWEDCGEHRMIFGLDSSRSDLFPFGRNFFIFEARVPNPTPGSIQGCANVINAWKLIGEEQDSGMGQATLLREFFISGGFFGPAIFNVQNFTSNEGQIRTNQFVFREWMLKEHKLEISTDSSGASTVIAASTPVKENPLGVLFNGDIANNGTTIGDIAGDFQTSFLASFNSLTANDFGKLSNPAPLQFNASQSHASGRDASNNNLGRFFNDGSDSSFAQNLANQLAGTVDANGDPLTTTQLLNRATAMTCGGCHQPGSFGLTFPGSIGAIQLPNGEIRDSWPGTLGFVHVDESKRISPALDEVFLPIREEGFHGVLSEFSQ